MGNLSDELIAYRKHAEWVRYEHGKGDKDAPPPAPSYKDCRNCSLRDRCETEEDRTDFCLNECPYDKLPPGPSKWFISASIWASLPEAFLLDSEDELGMKKIMDVQMIRESRDAERLGAMMGVSILGRH